MAVIETSNLTKQFGSGDEAVVAVDELSIAVEAGEVFGFLGPNGAGKSTTIDMLLDLVRPTAGTARILGYDVTTESEVIRQQIGILPEGLGLYDRLTGRRHLEFAIEWMDAADDPDQILERVGLSSAAADRRVGEYSKGMRQRLALGMAVIGDPAVLILDEPSSGLDPHGIQQMRTLVREEAEQGTAVFFSSHILGEVEAVCDRVGILHDGSLVAIDDVDSLRSRVGAGSELTVRVSEPVAIDLSAIDGVSMVSRNDDTIRVSVTDPRAKARVITALDQAGATVADLHSGKPSLEDVFTAYTETDSETKSPSDRDSPEVVA